MALRVVENIYRTLHPHGIAVAVSLELSITIRSETSGKCNPLAPAINTLVTNMYRSTMSFFISPAGQLLSVHNDQIDLQSLLGNESRADSEII